MNTYLELLSNIELQNLHDSDSIIPEQEDRVRISKKFDHPDFSDNTYPIFETLFLWTL